MSKNSPKKKSKNKTIYLPTIELDGGSYFLLSVLNKKWTFKATGFGKKRPNSHKSLHGENLHSVEGTGSVKCKPNKDYCLDFKFRVTEFPISVLESDRHILLSKKQFENKKTYHTWTFMAKKLDLKKTRDNRTNDPSGHGIGEAIGEKIVELSPKTYNVDDL